MNKSCYDISLSWPNTTNRSALRQLTNWGRVTHICVSELTIIVSDNGLSPGRRQAIIWNNAGLLLIEPLGTNFSEISIGIQTFSFTKMHLNMSSAKWRPFCLGLNVLISFWGTMFLEGCDYNATLVPIVAPILFEYVAYTAWKARGRLFYKWDEVLP